MSYMIYFWHSRTNKKDISGPQITNSIQKRKLCVRRRFIFISSRQTKRNSHAYTTVRSAMLLLATTDRDIVGLAYEKNSACVWHTESNTGIVCYRVTCYLLVRTHDSVGGFRFQKTVSRRACLPDGCCKAPTSVPAHVNWQYFHRHEQPKCCCHTANTYAEQTVQRLAFKIQWFKGILLHLCV